MVLGAGGKYTGSSFTASGSSYLSGFIMVLGVRGMETNAPNAGRWSLAECGWQCLGQVVAHTFGKQLGLMRSLKLGRCVSIRVLSFLRGQLQNCNRQDGAPCSPRPICPVSVHPVLAMAILR